jgi:hypothetical protein
MSIPLAVSYGLYRVYKVNKNLNNLQRFRKISSLTHKSLSANNYFKFSSSFAAAMTTVQHINHTGIDQNTFNMMMNKIEASVFEDIKNKKIPKPTPAENLTMGAGLGLAFANPITLVGIIGYFTLQMGTDISEQLDRDQQRKFWTTYKEIASKIKIENSKTLL